MRKDSKRSGAFEFTEHGYGSEVEVRRQGQKAGLWAEIQPASLLHRASQDISHSTLTYPLSSTASECIKFRGDGWQVMRHRLRHSIRNSRKRSIVGVLSNLFDLKVSVLEDNIIDER